MLCTGILSALAEEQRGLTTQLQCPRHVTHAGRGFWLGDLHGQSVVLALSKIGKVAAATTASVLIERFGVRRIVFTGVAGGLGLDVNVGDVVVGQSFIQHDIDASPLFPRYEIPLYDKTLFDGDAALTAALFDATRCALSDACASLGYPLAKAHLGLIASGDRFISSHRESNGLRNALLSARHDALAVEMEGAAVAQVCFDYGVAFAAMRTISDQADDDAAVDFPSFVDTVASKYALAIIERLFRLI